jgi:Domain of unknown function (DUF4145)
VTMPNTWKCGHCGNQVGVPVPVWSAGPPGVSEAILCPICQKVTAVADGVYYPPAREHGAVAHLPPDVDVAWNEAVNAAGAAAFTASEIMCRKILMYVAVDKTGAAAGKAFTEYIDELDAAGYVPTGLKAKIDEIRTRGNVANHELPASDKEVADKTLSVTRFLLVSIYELPNL